MADLTAHHFLPLLRSNAAGSRSFGMGRSLSWFESAGSLARNPMSFVHSLIVIFELVLASEAVAFSMVLASDHRAGVLAGIVAVLGVGVALEVRPTLRAEVAILDRTAKDTP